nr:zinc finger, CCHC-type [Tanacetum cinerariifolium]
MLGPTFGLLGLQSDYDGHGWLQTSGHCWTNQVQQRDYEVVTDHYIRMEIGNAPWPINETMVGIHTALDPFPETMMDADKTAALKTDVYKKAHSALLLCLDNKVLRKVNKDSATGVWLKLETLYMTKSLANKLYLKKKKLFTFYMRSGKKLSEHIDEFNKLIGNLTNIDVDINDEDQALMLLTSLPRSYANFVETLLYGRDSLTLEDFLSSLNVRELKKRTDAKDDGDGLYVTGTSDHRGNQGRGSSRSKSKGKGTYKLKCYICYSEDHLKKECPKRNKKKSTGFVKKNAGQGSGMHSEGYDNGDLLMVTSEERFLEWIMDSGIEKVRVQIKDGSSFVLENVRYIPNLNRNLISLGTLDREGYTMKLQNGRVKVIKGSLMVLSGTMKGNYVYSLDGWAESGEASVGDRESKTFDSYMNSATEWSCWAAYLINRSPYTALEKRTPIDLWPGHPANYEMLRIFSCVAYSHVNQGKLKPRSIKCIFLGYPDGVKGYRLWRLDDVKPKIIISRDVVFNESLMYKDTLKGAGAADSGKEVKFEVELQGMHDRAKRTTFIPARYRDEGNVSLSRPSWSKVDGMVAYAFAVDEEEDTHEPITFQEAINSFDKDEWVRAIEEDMSSLMKNHTWELVDQPPGQKLVTCKRLYKIKEGIEGVQIPRPDIMYAIRIVSRYLANPKYQGKNVDVNGYVDADYAKDLDKGRSITGYVFMVHGCVVSWKATLQHVVVLSTTEADYMALTKDVKESIWLKGLLIELRVNLRSGVVNCDNQSVIHLSRNAIFLERTKHINVRYHFIKEIMESKEIKVAKIGTKDNVADAFTKVVPGLKFKYCMEILGVGIN